MTQSAPASKSPDEPAYTEISLLAPLTIALQHATLDLQALVTEAWHAAINSVPLTLPELNVLVPEGRRSVAKPVQHNRTIIKGGTTAEYPWRARLCNSRPGADLQTRWQNWIWEVGVRLIEDAATIRLDVTGYRLTAGRIASAPELALLRHYLAVGIQAVDSGAVISGAHDWHDDWWQTTA